MNESFFVLHLLVLEHLRERLISRECSADSIRAVRVCSNILSPLLSGTRACVAGGGEIFLSSPLSLFLLLSSSREGEIASPSLTIFLSSLLSLTLSFSSSLSSSPARLSLSLSRRKFPSRGEISFSLFFSSFSHSLLLFLTFFLACASLSLRLLS